jgi:hypothetical protein
MKSLFALRLFLFFGLNDLIWLCRLCIRHLFVIVRGFLCHSRLLCRLCHLSFLGCLCIGDGLGCCTLLLYLVEVALYDGTGNCADFINLGDVDGLSGVLAFIVQPVLFPG